MDVNEIVVRSKKEREPMSFERLKFLCYFVAGIVAEVLGFVALFMIIYFMGV